VLEGREVLAVTGPHRQKFLHNVLSNDVEGLAAGTGRRAALMDVKGHLLALMRVLVGADTVTLETAAGRRAAVERVLVHYRVGAPVRFAAPSTRVLALLGPRAYEVLAAAGGEVPALDPEAHAAARVAGHEVRVARAGDLPAAGLVLHVPAEGAEDVAQRLAAAGATPIGVADLDALRIEDGRPWYGPDVTEANLLHETGLVREYHSPAKGCYVGQEVIARLEARGGHVNKLLRGLRLEAAVAAGAVLAHAGAEDAGRVTTASVSPRLGPIAMAYVHRSCAEPGTPLEAAGVRGTVEALPLLA
jgi:folate-binding protein YgfZ